MITLLNYGLGNIRAFYNIYSRLRLPVNIASSAAELAHAKKLILPGVGSFDWAINRLHASGMREVLDDLVLGDKVPVLGVCVGMQIMANRSEEGELPGLGWIDAAVKRLGNPQQQGTCNLALPHMGWNDVTPLVQHSLFSDLHKPRFYFLHSYYFEPAQPDQELAISYYGKKFTSVASSDHIIGVQFHPEKSHRWGVQLLKNFAEF
jgi:glutamine amidotransferase